MKKLIATASLFFVLCLNAGCPADAFFMTYQPVVFNVKDLATNGPVTNVRMEALSASKKRMPKKWANESAEQRFERFDLSDAKTNVGVTDEKGSVSIPIGTQVIVGVFDFSDPYWPGGPYGDRITNEEFYVRVNGPGGMEIIKMVMKPHVKVSGQWYSVAVVDIGAAKDLPVGGK